jgi:hypothetical protein
MENAQRASQQRMMARISILFALILSGYPGAKLAFADDIISVATCPGQTSLPVSFQIDCSKVKDQGSKQLCKPFIENEACKVFFAYRKITGIKLEEPGPGNCSSIRYIIYNRDDWPLQGGDSGGDALKCSVEYMADYSINVKAVTSIGPYDTHELLHEYQAALGALPYLHILFGPSQAEAMREIGDIEAYTRTIEQIRQTTETFEARFAKLQPSPLIADKCVLAEIQTEDLLYLDDNKNVYQFYRLLTPGFAKDQGDREARFNRMYDAVSRGKSKPFLIAHGCAEF